MLTTNMGSITVTDVRVNPGDAGFLLDDGKTAVLCDTGFGFTGRRLAENVEKVLKGRSLDYILLTHSHYDHALGTAWVVKAFPGVKVVAGAYAAKIFQKPSARAVMEEMDRKAAMGLGIDPCGDSAGGLRVDIAVNDGDTLRCGDLEFSVVALPGHTKCSVGYYLAREGLLLGVETLGVCFEHDTYLPSCLVGYKMTLDAFDRVKRLPLKGLLVPHHGVIRGEEAVGEFLRKSEESTVQLARLVCDGVRRGDSRDEILQCLTGVYYLPHVAPSYPPDAFALNTRIMIDLICRELLPEGDVQ